jgi:N-acetylmuramoyl-L-alanine amidase
MKQGMIKCPNCNQLFDTTVKPVEPKQDSNYLWIFDNGHGGMIDGVYQTAGKRSPEWEDGTQLFEGEFNRSIVNRLVKLCKENNIDYVNLVDTQEDISLRKRTDAANDIHREQLQSDGKPCIYVSVHANGFSQESAHGWGVYTSIGESKSDKIAQVLFEKAEVEFPDHKMRKDTRDGDADKEANFWVLRKTSMPAILSENFFMTNREESRLLLSEEGRDRIAKIHFEMIQEIESSEIV